MQSKFVLSCKEMLKFMNEECLEVYHQLRGSAEGFGRRKTRWHILLFSFAYILVFEPKSVESVNCLVMPDCL